MNRRFLLLVNPSAGGGRALDRLPAAEAEFARLGAEFRTARTRDIQHAADEARTAVERGETVAAMGGDGLLRPLAGVLHHTSSALAIIPGGRGNDLARVLEIPEDPAEAVRVAVEGDERMLDVGYVDDTPYLGIASFGFDSDANKIANEARLVRGNLVYVYAALRALMSWKPATFTATIDGERHEITGYSMGVCNSKAYGGGMYVAPQAVLDDGKLDIVAKRDRAQAAIPARPAQVLQGHPRRRPELPRVDRRGHRGRRKPHLRDLRRRGSDRRHAGADHRAPALPARDRPGMSPLLEFLARCVRALSRRLGRGGGTTLPGRLLLRADDSALRADVVASRSRRGARLRHQRENHHVRDGGGDP